MESSNECMLCGGGGNTMHFLFDCQEYPEVVWEALKDALNVVAETENIIIVHMFNLMKLARKNAKTGGFC